MYAILRDYRFMEIQILIFYILQMIELVSRNSQIIIYQKLLNMLKFNQREILNNDSKIL